MIAISTTTRADWGLLTPLVEEMKRQDIDHVILASNMHLMPELGMTVDEIRKTGENPVELPTAAPTIQETYANTARLYGDWLTANKPEALVILGDRYETLAVASAAVMAKIPIIHIAGGTVSEGAIDNAIRNALSQLSSLHLAETDLCAQRLRNMGIDSDRIHTVGALGVYNALNVPLLSREEIEESIGAKLPPKFFVGTLHAATLDGMSAELQMTEFLDGLGDFMTEHSDTGAILTYSNNDVSPEPLIRLMQRFADGFPARVILVPSLGMRRYLSAVALSEGVIGNSSSGMVEVASLGVPTLDIGIRQKGRECARSVIHCDHTRDAIKKGLDTIASSEVKALAARKENPYFRPDTPAAMLSAILSR